ncbi:MAG: hypothetical protein NUV80_00985 [Candidatus Berkelbacteria bacterium]|nr:hypothetical protein [Candidatus Berkelbacteria bacterium]
MKNSLPFLLYILVIAIIMEWVYMSGPYGDAKEQAGKFYILNAIVQSVKNEGEVTVQTAEGNIILVEKK